MIRPVVRLPPIEPRGVEFGISPTQASDGTDLRELLALELIYEDVHNARLRLVHLLATLGVAVWLTTAWPDLVSSTLHEALLWTMGILLVATVVAAVFEWICFSRREQQLGRLLPLAERSQS